MRKLRIALTKGRLEKKSVELFEKMGLDCTELIKKKKKQSTTILIIIRRK